jgi:hypothetical protein
MMCNIENTISSESDLFFRILRVNQYRFQARLFKSFSPVGVFVLPEAARRSSLLSLLNPEISSGSKGRNLATHLLFKWFNDLLSKLTDRGKLL